MNPSNVHRLAPLLVAAILLLPESESFAYPPRERTFLSTLAFLSSSRGGGGVVPPAVQTRIIRPASCHPISHRQRAAALSMAAANLDSDDPFQVLGMDEPTSDKKVIKRAYKRMAIQYHPDVATTKDSSPEEKKMASDRFAKINWAYEVLSGKRQNDSTYTKTPTSNTGSSTSGWSPPHRRSGGYASTSSASGAAGGSTGGSTGDGRVDWTDFMPKDYDEAYDAGGDSFGKIFSDLFVGAAAGAAGLGGPSVFRDFIEFLEGNVDGFGGAEDDAELRILLQTGDLDEVRNELDDTELVVQQLKAKLSGIKDEILTVTAEVKLTTRYMEKIEMEESLAELNARKEVIEGYIKKAQKRLLSLQTRYKELLTSGGGDSYGSGRSSRSSWEDIKSEAGGRSSSSSSSSSSYTTGSASSTSSSTASSSSGSQRAPKTGEDSWMNESFGSSSSRRGRGEGRRRSRSTRSSGGSSTSTSSSQQAPAREPQTTAQSPRADTTSTQRTTSSSSGSYSSSGAGRGASSNPTSSSSIRTTSTSSDSNVPPHRRTSGSYENQQEKDKRRLRELKVDDEFDKLKKELGL